MPRILRYGLLLAAISAAQVRDPLPVPDIPGYQTLKCDFHMHTVFSDGQVWPTARVIEAFRDGLDAIALTDHSGGGGKDEMLKNDLNLPYSVARPVAEQYGILLVPGVEVAQGLTHCNALFIKDANEVKGLALLPALGKLRAQDAFVIWNHPGWRRDPQWYPDVAAAHREGLIQGMEIVNGDETYPDTFSWVEEKKLTVFANSDVHGPMAPQTGTDKRPITLVFAASGGLAGIREALNAHRAAAWYRDDVWGAAPLLGGLWEGAVTTPPIQLNYRAGNGRSAIRFRNSSAIPFRVRVRKSPAWFELQIGALPAQRMVHVSALIARDAPAGDHRLDLDLEIANLHISPGRNLTVRLPVQVRITP